MPTPVVYQEERGQSKLFATTNPQRTYKKLPEEVIVELAKQSLADTDASITVIGGKLGYTEASAFVRAFKRMAGTTPVAYRKKARQNQAI